VCVDVAWRERNDDITKIFVFDAEDQFQRIHKCYEHVVQKGRVEYDWFLRVRPDFIYIHDFPDPGLFDPHYVYSRFRLAQGIAGLTSDHCSYSFCDGSCNGQPSYRAGYRNDDQLWAAPRELADRVFNVDNLQSEKYYDSYPYGWIVPSMNTNLNCPEDLLTKRWLRQKILSMPLAVAGYPLHSYFKDGIYEHSNHCLMNDPVTKWCGANPQSVRDVHGLVS